MPVHSAPLLRGRGGAPVVARHPGLQGDGIAAFVEVRTGDLEVRLGRSTTPAIVITHGGTAEPPV